MNILCILWDFAFNALNVKERTLRLKNSELGNYMKYNDQSSKRAGRAYMNRLRSRHVSRL